MFERGKERVAKLAERMVTDDGVVGKIGRKILVSQKELLEADEAKQKRAKRKTA
jgi:hypothetical protein